MNNYRFILLLIVIFLTIHVYKKMNYNENYNSNSIIYTCATYFDFEKQDKWTSFCNGIDSILKYHPNILNTINKWYVVNEYSDNNWGYLQVRSANVPTINKYGEKKGELNFAEVITATFALYKSPDGAKAT